MQLGSKMRQLQPMLMMTVEMHLPPLFARQAVRFQRMRLIPLRNPLRNWGREREREKLEEGLSGNNETYWLWFSGQGIGCKY